MLGQASSKRANSSKSYPCTVRSLRGFFVPQVLHIYAFCPSFQRHFQRAQLTIWKCPFDVLKEALWRAHLGPLTASFGLFDKTAPILRVVNKNNKSNTPYFSKQKAKLSFLLTTAVSDIYTLLLPVSAYLFISCINETSVSYPLFFSKNTSY